ncbi:hypothetical protein [Aliarcobacter butzleri]
MGYLFDSINIGEKFILTGGGRFDRYDTTNDIVSNTLVVQL